MAKLTSDGKIIVTIPNMEHYRGIKNALHEMLAQTGLKYNGDPRIDMDGKHLCNYAELLMFLEIGDEDEDEN